MIVIRIILGIIMMALSCVGLYFSIREDGLGCLGAIASAIACLVITITMQVLPVAECQTFWGMDYVSLSTAAGCLVLFCIIFNELHFSGIIGCLVLFFTGLLTTGLLDASTVSMLSDYVGTAGLVVFSPMIIPIVLIVLFIAI